MQYKAKRDNARQQNTMQCKAERDNAMQGRQTMQGKAKRYIQL